VVLSAVPGGFFLRPASDGDAVDSLVVVEVEEVVRDSST
jgi:hypothetical protein